MNWSNSIYRFDIFKARRAVLLSVLCFIAIVLSSSCKKERFEDNNTGKSLLSEQDLLNLSVYEFNDVTLSTIKAEPLKTNNLSSTVLLGSYVDPVFGKSSAEIYTQLRLDGPVDFGDVSGITITSLDLYLPIVNYYGVLDAQTFEVYQLSDGLSKSETYYSDNTVNTTGVNYVKSGFEIITPDPFNDIDSKGPALKISLDESFIAMILNENGNPSLGSNDESDGFVAWFKGLLIKTNTPQNVGEGAILGIDIQSSNAQIVFNYSQNSESKSFVFRLGNEITYFNNFNHNYSSTTIEAAINGANNTNFYLQPMSGVDCEIELKNLEKLSLSENFVINKAELVLPIEYDASSTYAVPGNIYVLGYNDNGENIFLPDQFLGNIGGEVNKNNKNYSFNITSYVNKVVSGEWSSNKKLYISTVGSAIIANRLVGLGSGSTGEKPILKLYYTTY